MKNEFKKGLLNGIPIALGYLSVSFGLGIVAVKSGLSVLSAVIISLTNLTSAGQAAGISIIAAGGTYTEMFISQLIINIRYALMGISLSQKLDKDYGRKNRFITAFGITDEIFAVASSRAGCVSSPYMYGLIIISTLGWVAGTFLGAAAGEILPPIITDAMGIVIYAMFLAIIIPPARDNKGVMIAVIIAAVLSIMFKYLLPFISSGFSIIICAVLSAALLSLICPKPQPEEDKQK